MKAATQVLVVSGSALLLLAVSALPPPVHAGPNANASLVLHLAEPTVVDPCLANSPIPGCQSLQTTLPYLETPVFAYILVERGNIDAGIGGAHFGMQFTPGFQVFSWSLCADAQTATGWPASGGGLTVSWDSDNCQRRVSTDGGLLFDDGAAVVGYFYCSSYAPAQLALTPHPLDATATVTDCSGIDDTLLGVPSRLGLVGLNGAPGYSPCTNAHLLNCQIDGPTTVVAGTTGHVYSASLGGGGPDSEWTITGNGTIVGPTNLASVTVNAGAAGSFRLFHRSPGIVEVYLCQYNVTVEEPTPALPGSWSRIKTLLAR